MLKRIKRNIYFTNKERYKKWDIPQNFHKNRPPGLSAMIRLKNEEEWIKESLLSIEDWFDEIVITLGPSEDRTEEIIKSLDIPHLKLYHYPFDCFPNGPGHDKYPPNSVHTRAYYYNWSLSKTTKEWVCKWDGDMVAMDWIGERIRELIKDNHQIIKIFGIDIAGRELKHTTMKKYNAVEPRFFRVSKDTYYYPGKYCEVFTEPGKYISKIDRKRIVKIEKPAFLHFKWAKSLSSVTKAWPENWEEIEHFRRVYKNAKEKRLYIGEYPKVIKKKLI